MKVFVTGATGALGRAAVRALLTDGHDVSGLARSETKARLLEEAEVEPVTADVFDLAAMTSALAGHDAVCNLVTSMPVGFASLRPSSWKNNDSVRAVGSRVVAAAARAAGVRQLVQESVSLMYADGGDSWIDESSPVCVTRAVEPAAVAETATTDFADRWGQPVILRFGNLMGDDPMTRWRLGRAQAGRPVGLGDPQGWAHVVHLDDAGRAVAAALTAPGGVYNVGAEPVRRDVLARVLAAAAGRTEARFLPSWAVKLAGERLEPFTRSHRVSSAKLHEATGWKPEYEAFDSSWLPDVVST